MLYSKGRNRKVFGLLLVVMYKLYKQDRYPVCVSYQEGRGQQLNIKLLHCNQYEPSYALGIFKTFGKGRGLKRLIEKLCLKAPSNDFNYQRQNFGYKNHCALSMPFPLNSYQMHFVLQCILSYWILGKALKFSIFFEKIQ